MRVAACLALLTLPAMAWSQVVNTPPTTRVEGGARWTESLRSTSLDKCSADSWNSPDYVEHYNCVDYTLVVTSESDRPIQCRMTLELAQPDFRGDTRFGSDILLYPGQAVPGVVALAAATALPARHSSTCAVIPAEATPAPAVPSHCTAKIDTSMPAWETYPRSAWVKKQEGSVLIEYTVPAPKQRISDVTIVKSSGFESLDRAALVHAISLRVTSNCEGQRFRHEIRFSLDDGLRKFGLEKTIH